MITYGNPAQLTDPVWSKNQRLATQMSRPRLMPPASAALPIPSAPYQPSPAQLRATIFPSRVVPPLPFGVPPAAGSFPLANYIPPATPAPAASRFSRFLSASPAALASMGRGAMAVGRAVVSPAAALLSTGVDLTMQAGPQPGAAWDQYTYDAMGSITGLNPDAGTTYNPASVSAPVQAYTPAARSVLPSQPAAARAYAQPVSAYANPNLPVYDKAMEDMNNYAQQPPAMVESPVYDKAMEDMNVSAYQQPPAMVTLPTPAPALPTTADGREIPPGWFWNEATMSWSRTPY